MKDKFDERTIRVFPYTIFIMLFVIMISMMAPMIRLIMGGNINDANLYQMNTNLYMICYMIVYLAIVWIFSCLYHLSYMTKWFNYSCNMTAYYIIAEAVNFFMNWLCNALGNPGYLVIIGYIIRLIPTTFIMLLFAFVMRGASELYEEMGRKKAAVFCRTLIVYWVAAFASQILLNFVIQTESGQEEVSVIYIILISTIYIYTGVVMILSYVNIKRFCYEYYLYSYNNRIRGV